jgi:DNA-binding MarR family transcriptional regulator
MPSPSLFGHSDAYRLYTGYAARLEKAGLADRFPDDADLRHIVVELLAERYAVEDVSNEPDLIDEATVEARGILAERRGDS